MKKATFKTLSILLAAVILVAALPVTAFANNVYAFIDPGHTTHLFEDYIWEENEFYSVDVHRIIIHITKQCSVCGELSENESIRYSMAPHDAIIVGSAYIYKYDSNEYHAQITCSSKTFPCCDDTTLIEPDYSTAVLLEHIIDPSVDQETEMQGDCIDCGATIYW